MAIAVTDRIRRGESGLAPFALAWQEDMKIGYITVADLTARDAIEEWRRLAYMTVYVISEDKEYQLGSNLTIAGQSWTEKTYGVPADVVTESELFDVDGFIQPQLIQNIFLNTSYVVASEAAMLALTSYTGNIFVRTDTSDVYIKLNNTNPALIGDFALASGGGAVLSVNGSTGVVSVTIANLLAVPANQTAFDAAVEANTEVLAQGGAITTLQGNFTTLSGDLADLDDYVQTHLGLQSLATNVQTPTIAEDGYVLKWDEGTTSFILAAETPTSTTFLDNVFRINDNADPTKQLAFEISGVSTATLRTLTIPNADGTIALTSDISALSTQYIKTAGTSILTADILINPATYNFEVASSTGRTGFLSNKDKFRANQIIDAFDPLFATGFTLSVNVLTSVGGSVTWTSTNMPIGGVTLYLGILEAYGGGPGTPVYSIYDQFTVNIPDGSPLVQTGFDNFSFYGFGSADCFIIAVPNDQVTYPYVSYHSIGTDLVDTGSHNVTESASLSTEQRLTLCNKNDFSFGGGWAALEVPLLGLNYYYELISTGHSFVGNTTILGNYDIEGVFTGRVPSFTLRNTVDTQTLFSVSEGATAEFNIRADGSGGGAVNSIAASTTSTSSGELVITSGSSGSTAGELTLQSYGDLNIIAGYDPIASIAGNIIINTTGGGYTQVSSPFKVAALTTEGDIPVVDASGNFSAIGIGTDTHVLTMVAGLPTWAAPSGGGGGGGGSGDVVGPASAVDNAITRYDGITGKLIKNSATSIADNGDISIGTDASAARTIFATGSDPNIAIGVAPKGNQNFFINFGADNGFAIQQTPVFRIFTNKGSASASNDFGIKAADGIAAVPNGQNLYIEAGNGAGTADNNGGNITITPGTKTGTGIPGAVNIGFSTSLFGIFGATPVVKQSAASDLQTFYNAIVAYGFMPAATLSGGGSGDVATDVIWDAAGDLAVGSGANTAVRLARGTALQVLRVNAGGTNLEWAAGGGDMLLGTIQTVTALKSFNTGTFAIRDTDNTNSYLFTTPSNLAADRNVSLPLLTGNDTFVFNDFAATLTNKTINLTNNTLAMTKAQLTAAVSDDDVLFAGDLGAGLAIETGSLIARNTIYAPTITANAYTLVASDNKKTLHIDNGATAVTVYLPNSLVDHFSCTIVNTGTGILTISAATTLHADATTIETQYTGALVYHQGSNVWKALGSLGSPSVKEKTIALAINDATAITTGGKTRTRVIAPFSGTIKRWKLISDQSTTSTIDIWKAAGAIPTNANTITASAKPALSAAELNSSSTLTGWTTSVTEGDVLMMEVEANDNALYLNLQLVIEIA